MARWAFMIDPETNNIGLYTEPVATGDPKDPNSARNAPLNDPDSYMANLIWHIQYDNMEVYDERTVTVTHPSVTGAADLIGGTGNTGNVGELGMLLGAGFSYDTTPVDHTLYNHGLGYEPMVYAAVDNVLLTPGHIVQVATGGFARYVSLWVDTSNVYLREFACRRNAAVSSFSQSYKLITIRHQRSAEGNDPPKLLDVDQSTGLVTLGDGRWRNDRRYLQVVPGGSPFGLCVGKNMDANNGAPRVVAADGTIYDPIPNTLFVRISIGGGTGGSTPTTANYKGSFTGGEVIQVQAP